ncbi:MAG TPA: hypothetical protein VEC35_22525 [Noviherbaspirillum sp.]|nr:hypothetical protein [Noviherbaspirillum sp.]
MNDLAITSARRIAALRHGEETIAAGQSREVMTSVSEFNQRAGVAKAPLIHHKPRSLQDRFLATQTRPQRRPGQASRSAQRSEHPQLSAAASALVDALQHSERPDLEERLATEYDPLERHTLLRRARELLDEGALPAAGKSHLKDQLNQMMTDLMDGFGDVIRSGFQHSQAFETALGKMVALSAGDRLPDAAGALELRQLYGAKGAGKVEAPLTPLALVKSLQEKFGANHVRDAMASLRSSLSGDLRSTTATGPRLWLSLSDAACFNTVQTSFVLADDLRRGLFERAQVLPKTGQVATALALLEAAESAMTTGDALIDQIVERKGLAALQLMQAYMLVRHALERLAFTAWSEDHLTHRMHLLDELRALAHGAGGSVPASWSAEGQLESTLRTRLRPPRDGEDGDGHPKKRQEQGDENDGESDDRKDE